LNNEWTNRYFKETTYYMKNKIMPSGRRRIFFMILLTVGSLAGAAQSLPRSSYGLSIVNSRSLYRQTLRGHPEKAMIPLTAKPGLFLDLRYASKNNFTGRVLYAGRPRNTWLRKPAADALDSVLSDLKAMQLGLKIFDAYRPYSVTVALWEQEPDPRYAADPAKGSGHNRGIAVDLTLVDLKTGDALQMPTGFDNFSDSAHQDFMDLPPAAIHDRALLKTVMEKHGFIALPTEWWHFSWPDPAHFEVLDLDFREMEKISRP
jgi:D-alanyl-D-alanine dipeptidase